MMEFRLRHVVQLDSLVRADLGNDIKKVAVTVQQLKGKNVKFVSVIRLSVVALVETVVLSQDELGLRKVIVLRLSTPSR